MSSKLLYGLDTYKKEIEKICSVLLADNNEEIKLLEVLPTFIFTGLPGTGKTSLAYEIYEELKKGNNIDFETLNFTELTSDNFDASSKNLKKYFDRLDKQIEENSSKVFLLIDELDSHTTNRHSTGEHTAIKRFFLSLNKIIDQKIRDQSIYKYIIIATTNMDVTIDYSVRRRFFFDYNFDKKINKEEFKEYLSELYNISKIDNSNESDHFYEAYKNKNLTLGEVKKIFGMVVMKKHINKDYLFEKVLDSVLIEFKSAFEIYKLQREGGS